MDLVVSSEYYMTFTVFLSSKVNDYKLKSGKLQLQNYNARFMKAILEQAVLSWAKMVLLFTMVLIWIQLRNSSIHSPLVYIKSVCAHVGISDCWGL